MILDGGFSGMPSPTFGISCSQNMQPGGWGMPYIYASDDLTQCQPRGAEGPITIAMDHTHGEVRECIRKLQHFMAHKYLCLLLLLWSNLRGGRSGEGSQVDVGKYFGNKMQAESPLTGDVNGLGYV